MRLATQSTKDIFMHAARQGRAAHISVHIDMNMMNMVGILDTFQRAWIQSQKTLDLLDGRIPSLITTMGSSSILIKGAQDLLANSASYSAIDNPTHTQFLESNTVKVALISGVAATKCVKETMRDCLERDITPIMIMDAIDLAAYGDDVTPENYDEFRKTAEMAWGGDVLTTHTGEVAQWIEEFHAT